jgi:ribosomal peptide maturation radical SAM protein 1
MRQGDLHTVSPKGDALLIVPPFADFDGAALGPHLLQACAREAGFDVRVLYANLLLAAEIGAENYRALCYAPMNLFLGERLFAAAAYGVPPLGGDFPEESQPSGADSQYPALPPHELRRLETTAARWIDNLVAEVLTLDFPIMGCSTTFYQTASSIALLRRLKRLRPSLVTILGGANCEGEMAEGILSLQVGVDYVFSGESEDTFPRFLQELRAGPRPQTPIVQGEACRDLDALPTPDFSDYYEQRRLWLSDESSAEDELWLPYESSRGCWWGQKHHCTFCGLNGQTMAFRAKSPDRVVSDLKQLVAKHGSKKVNMVDNIMPHPYFRQLLPRLDKELPGLHLFYEQKANLSLSQVLALQRAGVAVIQPGIEALCSSLLKRMDKGVTASQNLALLRYARAADVAVTWNLLYDFPGDQIEDYEQTLALLPLLHHLTPPNGVFRLSLDRFSPYFDKPAKYGVRNLRPWRGYADVLPPGAEVAKVAYHFEGDYASGCRERPDLFDRLQEEIAAWRRAWQSDKQPPALMVLPLEEQQYLLIDTRGLPGMQELTRLTRAQASLVLTGARRHGMANAEIAWALERKLLVELDGGWVPLATADPEVLQEFESEIRCPVAAPVRLNLEVLSPVFVCA